MNSITRTELRNTLSGVILAVGLAGLPMMAQDPTPPAPATQPDNTRTNQRDRAATEPTADQQSNAKSDRDLASSIRKSITTDKTLSTYAHNVKVIVQQGTVTLKGPVRSEEEKSALEAKARGIAGRAEVRSEITIAPK